MAVFDRIKLWARAIKRDVIALWLAARDARTPVLGYLDDLLIVPLGILLAVWLIPAPLMAEFREVAASRAKPVRRAGLAFIVAVWLAAGAGLSCWLWTLV